MIGYIRGRIVHIGQDKIILDNNGIGYRIFFTQIDKIKLNDEVTIYTYQHVREDEISLYGFLSLDDYDLFMRLTSVKGLGPKIGMNILANYSSSRIIEAIEGEDLVFIKSLKGVGNKMASQIILDLKGKLVSKENDNIKDDSLKDVIDALKSLGYRQNEIMPVLNKLKNENLSEDELIKRALTQLI